MGVLDPDSTHLCKANALPVEPSPSLCLSFRSRLHEVPHNYTSLGPSIEFISAQVYLFVSGSTWHPLVRYTVILTPLEWSVFVSSSLDPYYPS